MLLFSAEGTFEIEDYQNSCYLYECLAPLRALMTQKTAPSKYKKIMSLESNEELRRGKPEWQRCKDNVIDVMKKESVQEKKTNCN